MKFGKCFVGAMTLLAFTLNSPQVLANGIGNVIEKVPTEVPEGVPHLDDEDVETYDFEFDEVDDIPPKADDVEYNAPFEKSVTPKNDRRERILPPSKINTTDKTSDSGSLKQIKTRFLKLAIDDTYTYYLDKQSVSWKRMPYSASEYMADVWIRMVEHETDDSDVPTDLANYLEEDFSREIAFARERGYKYSPTDIEVLKHKRYFLEHYYLRPKTQQIQFLSELEVVGHPQNTIRERDYEYRNWEYLIPGSVEDMIYRATIKEIGKSKASERGHMTFTDMLEEYGRISIR